MTFRTFLRHAPMRSRPSVLVALLLLFLSAAACDNTSAVDPGVVVTLTQGTNMAASVSQDGERLLLSLQGSLWVLPAAGGEADRLTGWEVEATHATWSPDGARIAFQRFHDHYYQLFVLEADGSGLEAVTAGFFDHREPAWSPDGRALAFSSDRGENGSYDLWSVALDGGVLTRWTDSGGDAHSPAWSPDGARLAYVEGQEVRWTDGEGSGGVLAAVGAGSPVAPSWSPEGVLAYQDGRRRLVLDGRTLEAGEDLFPFPVSWLPDGGFVHTADGAVRLRDAGGHHIRDIPFQARLALDRAPVRSSARRVDDPGPHPVRGIFAPALSPDGNRVAFTALHDVWVVDVQGGAPRRLTEDGQMDWVTTWSPDGEFLYVNSDRAGTGKPELYSLHVASGEILQLSELPDARMIFPTLSPDGERVAFIDGVDQSLWTLELKSRRARRVASQAYASNVGRPTWSPDGRTIALADIQRISTRFREGRNLIRTVDVETGEWSFHEPGPLPAQLSERFEAGPVWSPDGEWMAFVMNSVLHVLPVDARGAPTGEARRLTDHLADMPSWGPDGTLVYLSRGRLRTIRMDGSQGREIPVELRWERAVAEGETRIRVGGLWDGIRPELQEEMLIRLEGSRIVEVRPFDPALDREAEMLADGIRYIDARELTAIPGLWDAHVHPRVQDYAAGWWGVQLAYGITTALSNGTSTYHTLLARESLESGTVMGPRLLTSPLYDGTRPFYGHHRAVGSPEALELELEQARELEMDYLKAYVRAPVTFMRRIAQAADHMGVPNGSHFLSPGIQAGMGGTTHLSASQRMGYSWASSPAGRSYQDVMALYTEGDFHISSHHARGNQLLGEEPGLLEDPRLRLMPPNYMNQIRFQASRPPTEEERRAVREDVSVPAAILRGGGMVTLGSDTPLSWPALGLHAQLRAFAYEISPHEALQSVTANAARYAYLDHDLGTLEAGKIADIVLVRGNPLENVAHAAAVEVVLKNGVVFTMDRLLELR